MYEDEELKGMTDRQFYGELLYMYRLIQENQLDQLETYLRTKLEPYEND